MARTKQQRRPAAKPVRKPVKKTTTEYVEFNPPIPATLHIGTHKWPKEVVSAKQTPTRIELRIRDYQHPVVYIKLRADADAAREPLAKRILDKCARNSRMVGWSYYYYIGKAERYHDMGF